MSTTGPTLAPGSPEQPKQPLWGLTRRKRIQIYLWSGLVLALAYILWAWAYLQPSRWYKYTDQVAFEQVARDVKLGHVMWEPAAPEGGGLPDDESGQDSPHHSSGAGSPLEACPCTDARICQSEHGNDEEHGPRLKRML